MTINKELRFYISKIKTLLPVYSRLERQFIKSLKDNIYDFIEAHPGASMEEVIVHFGEPFEIVQGYIESMEIETLLNAIAVRKMLRRIIIIILIGVIGALSVFGYYSYRGYQYYKNTVVMETKSIVEND